MAWELEIHIIDVGQGESSLIIAKDSAAPGPNNYRSMLIDGGHRDRAEIVHRYVANIIGNRPLDTIVTTHDDIDHVGGVIGVLTADNLSTVALTLANAAGAAAHAAATSSSNNGVLNQISAAAAAGLLASCGAYDNGKRDLSNFASEAGKRAQILGNNITENYQAANYGIDAGISYFNTMGGLNKPLIPDKSNLRFEALEEAGVQAGLQAGDANARANATYLPTCLKLLPGIDKNYRFATHGLYHKAKIIDIGAAAKEFGDYIPTIEGKLTYGKNIVIQVPNERGRVSPLMGYELLWRQAGNGPAPPPGAPAAFVVTYGGYVRDDTEDAAAFAGEKKNRMSIGLIIRFNNFFYFTGGDLPKEGENRMLAYLLGNQNIPLMADNTQNPALGRGFFNDSPPPANFDVPNHICCFKVSHHGSHESSSAYFVNNINASAAFISAGKNDSFAHPDQVVIDNLQNKASIQNFYLTNCNYHRNHVPGSQGQFQKGKSRVAGDNAPVNQTLARNRGDVAIFVNEAESLAAPNPPVPPPLGAVRHGFRVRYWDKTVPIKKARMIVSHSH